MNLLCKALGIVDIAAAILLFVYIPQSLIILKYLFSVILAVKGVSSLLG